MFDAKIAIVVRDDLLTWQKLNVTAFLASGVLGADAQLLGDDYEDASGQVYRPLIIQPMIVLTANGEALKKIHRRGIDRGASMAIYIEDMFATGHDAANRAAVKHYATDELALVGLALRDDRKVVDKITKGAKMHP
ncbi:MAG: DUF2000 family protein [Rhodobiaceae bacterium]|nr:DUF2000 family protein [Rhodobiaceae bacterium]